MSLFSYNSRHKVFTAIGVLLLINGIYWFTRTDGSDSYANGQSKGLGQSTNGKNNGYWVWYYKNGKKRLEGNFVEGKREGKWTTWDSKGHKLSENMYVNDMLNGESVGYDTAGNIISSGMYLNDQPVSGR